MFEAYGLPALKQRWGEVRKIGVFIDNRESVPKRFFPEGFCISFSLHEDAVPSSI